MPSLNDPVPSIWSVIESEFVFVNLTSMSHMSKQNFVLNYKIELNGLKKNCAYTIF